MRTAALLRDQQTYLENDHRATVVVLFGSPARIEPVAVVRHPSGLGAVAELSALARASGWRNVPDGSPLHELLRGAPLGEHDLLDALGPELFARARASGLLVAQRPRWRLGFGVLSLGDALVPVPREHAGPDMVYYGGEAMHLEAVREALAITGTCADLGCGAGQLGVVMARSVERVVSTDIAPRCVAMTRLAYAMNPDLAHHSVVVRSDVAAGLRSRSFDFVVANPPWVPTRGDGGRVFADGGPTGCELPLRFLTEGLELLREEGVLAISTLDPTMADGRRPIRDAMQSLGDEFVGRVVESPFRRSFPEFESRIVGNHPTVTAAMHVVVLVARRPRPEGNTAARLDGAIEVLRRNGWPS